MFNKRHIERHQLPCVLKVFNRFSYRLEARAPVMEPQVLLYDASRKVLVNEPSNVFCIP